MSGSGEIAAATGAAVIIKALLENTTIYEDAIQPAARAFGNTSKPAAAAAGRTASALAKAGERATDEAISVMSNAYQRIKGWFVPALAERLEKVPRKRI